MKTELASLLSCISFNFCLSRLQVGTAVLDQDHEVLLLGSIFLIISEEYCLNNTS